MEQRALRIVLCSLLFVGEGLAPPVLLYALLSREFTVVSKTACSAEVAFLFSTVYRLLFTIHCRGGFHIRPHKAQRLRYSIRTTKQPVL